MKPKRKSLRISSPNYKNKKVLNMSEDTTQIEDVQEDTLVEEETETTEVVESSDQEELSLSETVLKTLIGESTEEEDEESLEEAKHSKKKEAKDEDEDDEEDDIDEAKEEDDDDDEDEDEDIDEAMHGDDDDDDEEEAPKTKAEILNQMYKEMKGMKKSQLQAAFDKLDAFGKQKDEAAAEPANDGEKAIDATVSSIKKSADDAKKTTKGDLLQASYKIIKSMKKSDLQANYGKLKKELKAAYGMDESFDLESEVDLLVQADSNLSEEFKDKAQVVFEAAIANKVYDIKASLEEQYNSDLQEEISHVRDTLIEKIDSYLTYVVEEWTEENEELVESKLRADITEGFIKGLQNLFLESYIDVPTEKRDLVNELEEKVGLIEGSLDQAESDKEDLQEQLEDLLRDKIIREHSEDLTSTQVEKLNHLLDGAEFVSEESFSQKVATVKETFFSAKSDEDIAETTTTSGDVEVVVEGQADVKQEVPADMKHYVQALNTLGQNSSFINN
jgi:hypothetical protein